MSNAVADVPTLVFELTTLSMYSPTIPAAALSLVFVPLVIPFGPLAPTVKAAVADTAVDEVA
jgi:hypothetical protein